MSFSIYPPRGSMAIQPRRLRLSVTADAVHAGPWNEAPDARYQGTWGTKIGATPLDETLGSVDEVGFLSYAPYWDDEENVWFLNNFHAGSYPAQRLMPYEVARNAITSYVQGRGCASDIRYFADGP